MEGWGAKYLTLTMGFGGPVGVPTREVWAVLALRDIVPTCCVPELLCLSLGARPESRELGRRQREH
eukprot:12207363-Alexandrium_andersonii.AAC.1